MEHEIAPVAAGPCTDAERRVALAARRRLQRAGAPVRTETIWVRPQWQLAQAAHCGLVVAGGLLSNAGAELAGLILTGTAVVATAGELTGRARWLRLLLPARATQSVVSRQAAGEDQLTLVICANLDSPPVRRPRPAPAWLWAVMVLLMLLAGLRVDGRGSAAVAVAQFVLLLVVLAAAAMLLESAAAGAGKPGVAADAAIELQLELLRTRPAALVPTLVLSGAGQAQSLGLEHALRELDIPDEQIVVLALEDAPGLAVGWHLRDGPLVPLRMHPRLLELIGRAALAERQLGAAGRRSRAWSGAYCARRMGLATLAVEGSDADSMLELCLAWVGLLDADLARS